MIEYRILSYSDIEKKLFNNFTRRQEVNDCWRRVNGEWVIKSDPFIDDWSDSDYDLLVKCLKNTVKTGGFVMGAFCAGALKGFVSVESEIFGGNNEYMDLTSIHVSEDKRGLGIGKTLFAAAREFASSKGAKKLYISAHSAVESQAFYKKMGCTEAKEYSKAHVEKEPFDCQLECNLVI